MPNSSAPDTAIGEIPLARPSITDQEQSRVRDVLQSDRLSRGPYLDRFETRMAEQCGTDHAVALSSGTAALHCIVSALDLAPGAEDMTFQVTIFLL